MVFGQPLVVADAAPVLHDPSGCALDDPAAGQGFERVQVIGAFDDLQGAVQRAGGPGDQLAGVAAVGPDQGDGAEPGGQAPQQRAGAAAVLDRGGDHDAKIRPITSTARCRLRPSIFFPALYPRLFLPTVPAALTDWESMIAAVGCGRRPGQHADLLAQLIVHPPGGAAGLPAVNIRLTFACLALLGMPIGELFELEALAGSCAADGRYTGLLTSAPLRLPGGIASPPNAVVVR